MRGTKFIYITNMINKKEVKMKYKIPNLQKILKPLWAHNPGEAVGTKGWYKQDVLMQGSIPRDRKILEKLGIKRETKF